jgi:hypothetical protein
MILVSLRSIIGTAPHEEADHEYQHTCHSSGLCLSRSRWSMLGYSAYSAQLVRNRCMIGHTVTLN